MTSLNDPRTTVRHFYFLLGAAALITMASGCLPAFDDSDRAAEENEEYSGWQDRGRNPGAADLIGTYTTDDETTVWHYDLDYSDVVLTPNGDYIMAMLPAYESSTQFPNSGLYLALQPTAGGAPTVFPFWRNLRRINFSPDGTRAYLLTEHSHSVDILDLTNFEHLGSVDLGGDYSVLDVSPDGNYLVVSNLPITDTEELWSGLNSCNGIGVGASGRCRIEIVDLSSRVSRERLLSEPIRDLDFSPVDGELIVTGQIQGSSADPVTRLTFINPQSTVATGVVEVPNCVDELKIQPGGTLALLSPTTCRNGLNLTRAQVVTEASESACPPPTPNQDPISVIDLQARAFVKNLPGFGPVQISADGKRAVGFTRKVEMAEEWNFHQDAPAGIIVVELPSLEWKVIDFGELEPTYLLAPDGRHLYTYVDAQICKACPTSRWTMPAECRPAPADLSRIDLMTGVTVPIFGGETARLDTFVVSESSGQLFFLDTGEEMFNSHYPLRRVTFPDATAPAIANIKSNLTLMTADPNGHFIVFGNPKAPSFSFRALDGRHIQTLNPSL